jgi:hypothetical protein
VATVTGSVVVDGQTYPASTTVTVTTPPTALKRIGMSSPADQWDQRLAEVGPNGITSYHIYADVSSSGISQMSRIDEAISLGMTPVITFKFGSGSVSTAGSGGYNAWVTTAMNQLQAKGVPMLVACWHEPFDDMTGPQWLAIQRQVLPLINAKSNLESYCILHGWLTDNRIADWDSFMAPDVFALLDYMGLDSYQSGTPAAPGTKDLSTRMPTILDWLEDQGDRNKPLVIGEYNAYTVASLNAVQSTILNTPNVKHALAFNSATGGKGVVFTGAILSAFKAFKARPEVEQ